MRAPAARACSTPTGVSGTSGVGVKTRSRLPSLSPCRMRTSRPTRTLPLAVHAVDQLPQPTPVEAVEAEHEAGERVQLGLLLDLLGEGRPLRDGTAGEDVG